jgi:hypothetical protein
MNVPILLSKYDLVNRIDLAIKKIHDIQQTKEYWSNQIVRESMFISLFSSVEICINDLIAILFEGIPSKIPKSDMTLSKDDILKGTSIKEFIEKYLLNIAYKSLNDYFKEFEKIFGLNIISWQKHKNVIIEHKATRNLLIHT